MKAKEIEENKIGFKDLTPVLKFAVVGGFIYMAVFLIGFVFGLLTGGY